MKKLTTAFCGLLLSLSISAEDVSESKELVCASSRVLICFEHGECMDVMPDDIGMPPFVVVDLKKKMMRTTKASQLNRETPATSLQRADGKIILQGIEANRAFSITIDEATGFMTASIARDGFTVSSFGSCTDTDL